MDIAEILTALTEYVGDDKAKAKEVAQSLRSTEGTKPIASVIYNAGAARHKGESGPKITELETQVSTLTEERDDLTQQLEAAKGKPDEQKAEFDRQKKKLEDRATKAETDLKAERDGRKGDRVGHAAGRIAGRLKGMVDDDYLAEVLTPRIQKRVRPTEQNTIELLAEDETPLDGDSDAVEKALAESILKAVPDKYRLRDMQPGGGVSGGGVVGSGKTLEQVKDEKRRSGVY